ncbi:thiopeptide-type bacteriocin biosynthesis protein [Streptomyces sp. HD]|uniref:thiopeptide-type bacteriocin biosynthesis protein n=1 Tax=Streptomyces sp. HD TaxID=3020892 RepID=UPI00232F70A7|nr:thiopeptide-type bacteriocin biosynthesis protein [Streptomyces sp. HD]MDC0772865.1 thiopeptide-type bacteriocin biosynthesis protein [Streptomyces sp. HD]
MGHGVPDAVSLRKGSAGVPTTAFSDISIDGKTVSAVNFMRLATEYLESGNIPSGLPQWGATVDRFVRAGASALVEEELESRWVERRVYLDGSVPREVYVQLSAVAEELLKAGRARNFFFVHKPPGMRIRFECDPQSRIAVRDALLGMCSQATRDGLVLGHHSAVYEPEYKLFGGAAAMAGVHGMFTADSLVWMDYWGGQRQTPAWALSLRLIRSLFSAMEITDAEDQDVWDRLGCQAGRKFSDDEPEPSGWPEIAHRIRLMWGNPEHLSSVTSSMNTNCASFEERVSSEWAKWNSEYFRTDPAVVGPREAAAFLIVFHWNRARLPFSWQAGIATALANVVYEREVRQT